MSKAFYALALTGGILLAGCSGTRHLPPGEHLYTGARTKITQTDDLTVRQRKVLDEDLENLVRPRPNSSFLGLRFKLGIYNLFYKAKPNSFFGRLRDRLGEPPVLLSSVDINNNIKLLDNHAQNKGFFLVHTTIDSVVSGRKGHLNVNIAAGPQYTIN
ncbi:MAG: hypothetical protein EOO12_14495, partial [Chitinophagaceae bacterium]